MTTWKERLCGTIVLKPVMEKDQPTTSMHQVLNPSEAMSNGGVWNKSSENAANMSTFKSNFILPTENYSVMIFNEEGTAIIFSDAENPAPSAKDHSYSYPMSKTLN